MSLQRALAVVIALVGWAAVSAAAPAVDNAADTALESRVNQVAAELRCLVCQNQTIADSHAELAIDLKNQVREQLRAGRSESEVIAYMTQRYGDFIRYRPPMHLGTMLLWLGPGLLLVLAGLAWWRTSASGSSDVDEPGDPPRADVKS